MYALDYCSVKDGGRDCRTCPARPNYQARTGTEKLAFVFSLPRADVVYIAGLKNRKYVYCTVLG